MHMQCNLIQQAICVFKHTKIVMVFAFVWCMFPLIAMSQSVVENCATYGNYTSEIASKEFYYVKSSSDYREIWVGDTFKGSNNTNLRLPRESANLILSPNGSRLAYTLPIMNQNKLESEIGILDISTGQNTILVPDQVLDTIMLHWVDNDHLSFISDYQHRQYTILELNGNKKDYLWPKMPNAIENDDWWFIEFNFDSNFTAYAATSNGTTLNEIRFFDLKNSDSLALIANNPEISPSLRNYAWSLYDPIFLFMDTQKNWNKISMNEKIITQITNVGEIFYLKNPAISSDSKVAFEAIRQPLSRPNISPSLVILNHDTLLNTCQYGQLDFSERGWDSEGRYFVFFSFNQSGQQLFALDTTNNTLLRIDRLDKYDDGALILGWKEIGHSQ